METGFLAAISKKVITAIIAVGSMFYSTIDGVTPSMSPPEIYYKNDNIFISTTIENCYTDELEKIFFSGNTIPLRFSIELFRNGQKEPDSTFYFYHTLQYLPIGDNFTIYCSEKNELETSLNIIQVKSLFTTIADYRVLSYNNIRDNTHYYFKITAWLDKIHLAGLEDDLNLIYYWNSIKPTNKSALFTKSDFQL